MKYNELQIFNENKRSIIFYTVRMEKKIEKLDEAIVKINIGNCLEFRRNFRKHVTYK